MRCWCRSRNFDKSSRSAVIASILAWYTSWEQLLMTSPKNRSSLPMVRWSLEFSSTSSSMYSHASSVLVLFTEATALGFHKPPGAGTNGGLALGSAGPSLAAGVDIGIEAGAFHLGSIARQSLRKIPPTPRFQFQNTYARFLDPVFAPPPQQIISTAAAIPQKYPL